MPLQLLRLAVQKAKAGRIVILKAVRMPGRRQAGAQVVRALQAMLATPPGEQARHSGAQVMDGSAAGASNILGMADRRVCRCSLAVRQQQQEPQQQ